MLEILPFEVDELLYKKSHFFFIRIRILVRTIVWSEIWSSPVLNWLSSEFACNLFLLLFTIYAVFDIVTRIIHCDLRSWIWQGIWPISSLKTWTMELTLIGAYICTYMYYIYKHIYIYIYILGGSRWMGTWYT